ncbi:serine hydrolase [Myxococcota bacterium]|nr:serine hydrolase [Myxococcota bacterium]MBU1382381.1 serine hydrolase [Myxococcota bacterium]MBU1498717.1 serine hydrolase [Myxococcota bacterium]
MKYKNNRTRLKSSSGENNTMKYISSIDKLLKTCTKNGIFPDYGYSIFKLDNIIEGGNIKIFFDIASVTKPIASLCLLHLVTNPDAPISEIDERFVPPLGNKSLSSILRHEAGFVPWIDFFKYVKKPLDIIDFLNTSELIYDVNLENNYSDIGYIIAGILLDRLTGNWHDWLNKVLLKLYIPESQYIFYTANDGISHAKNGYENRINDDNAFFFGKLCAHAGLYSNISLMSEFLISLISNYTAGNHRKIYDYYFKKSSDTARFTCGLDTPSINGYTSAPLWPIENTFGHLGFSGTAFWFNTQLQGGAILFTNRCANGTYWKMDEMKKVRSEFFRNAYLQLVS